MTFELSNVDIIMKA